MTKSIPGGLAAVYAGNAPTLAYALKITRPDTTVFGFTSATKSDTISSVLYSATNGLDVSSLVLTAGVNVDNLQLTTLDDGTIFTKADVLEGRWRNSTFLLFRYDWTNVANGIDPLLAGTIGEVFLKRETVVAELHGLTRFLQQPVGPVSSKLCRYRLGVSNGFDSFCPVNLAALTVTGSVTTATSNQVFTDSTKAQASDYFGEGLLTWTSGPSAGLTVRVKTFAGGVFTLAKAMLQTVSVGHTFSVSPGCRLREIEDCKTKFNVVVDFGGEARRPLPNDLLKQVSPSA